jgi:hypothetical protein
MTSLLPILLCSAAFADEPGFYHPDFVGPHSQLFQKASAHVAEQFGAIEGEMARVSPFLVDLDEGAVLCSERAPDGFISYAAELRRESSGQTARVQAFVDTLVDDFEVTFGGAMERVLEAATTGFEVELCKAEGVHALMGRSQCEGEDLAPRIGAAMDRDTELMADVDEILELPWPEFEIEGRLQPVVPITGIGAYLRLDMVKDALLTARIAEAKARHAAAMEAIEADLEEGETQAVRDAALQKAEDYRAIYERDMASIGEEAFDALEASLLRLQKKGKAPGAVGVCANPQGLGGCGGEDVTETVLPSLLEDKKLLKTLGL